MNALQGVLFDLDGTLVDSEPLWFEVARTVIERHGAVWTSDSSTKLLGVNLPKIGEALQRAVGRADLSGAYLLDEVVQEISGLLRESVIWRPGAVALLASLNAAGVPIGLVTASYQPIVDAVKSHLPAGTFQTTVSGNDVSQGKPHPESYLLGAKRLGVAPELCVAIEDSPTGIASAEGAGCHVIGVPSQQPLPESPGRLILTSLEEIDLPLLRSRVGASSAQERRK